MGGWAAIVHGVPRATFDVDLFVEPTEANVARLISALSDVGFGIARELVPKEILSRKAFLFADQLRIDLFTQPPGLPAFEVCHGRRHEAVFEGVAIPVLSLEDLLESKRTGRPQDDADRKALEGIRARRSPPGGATS
jgi:hypothetical protein